MPPTGSGLPALGEEHVPPGEARSIQIVTDACVQMMEVNASPVPRQQHGKGHGVVSAVLHVAPDVDPSLRHGILREPRSFRAVIRFSNGGQSDDRKKDAHGLALKVFGVEGQKVLDDERNATTQDFVFMDHETFFMRDAATYADFAIALQNGTRRARTWFGGHLPKSAQGLVIGIHLFRKFFFRHAAEFGFIQQVRSEPPASPLETQYHSVTPARLGPHAVRWALVPRPLSTPIAVAPGDASDRDDRLRAVMVAQLLEHSAAFDVFVQRQTDPVAMPVEDPTVAWDLAAAPLQRVGTLDIPAQVFDTPHKRRAGDALSFTPWHSLLDHRPLGGISRVRRAVYQVVAEKRRELNGQPVAEPGDSWFDEVWEAQGAVTPGQAAG